ncbi:MAG: NAD(P)/FAD-dependent oxidoreductase [Acidimicrobiia bacterium]
MIDAVIVGSGPNGLAAAITLAAAGKSVRVIEGRDTIGGGTRTEELTEPGIPHDVCSAVHPLAAGSPFFASLPLQEHGLEWAHPTIPLAHPFDDGSAAVVHRSLDETADGLGVDGTAWKDLFGPFVADWDRTAVMATAPPIRAARAPVAGLRLARVGLRSGRSMARRFATDPARAVIGGLAAHSVAPLDTAAGAGVALVLGAAAHAVGWPFARGGSNRIVRALASHLESLGGEIDTGRWVRRLGDLPDTHAIFFDTAPQAAAAIAAERIPMRTRRRYARVKPGSGVFKIDVVTDGPIPWVAEACRSAGTVHVGGTYEEIEAAEAAVPRGEHPDRPFVLAAQPLVADPARAPDGVGILWAYCHVPNGSDRDMTEPIIRQIERFAPGFQRSIRAMSIRGPSDLESDNPNYAGGDITGGAVSLWGVLSRPRIFRPYRAGDGVYLCSAATPPGAGVHGMCGHHAARAALADMR